MNKCWTEGNPDELNNYFHENMVSITPIDKNRLEGRTACVAGWSAFAKNATIHSWNERDHKIQLFGDTAIVTCYFDISFSMGGQTMTMSGRDMFALIKEKNRWWVITDQFSPFPP
jgi:ketosteroid isomerase-like protein